MIYMLFAFEAFYVQEQNLFCFYFLHCRWSLGSPVAIRSWLAWSLIADCCRLAVHSKLARSHGCDHSRSLLEEVARTLHAEGTGTLHAVTSATWWIPRPEVT
ncbi:UNVERIFIED_CONTAM: hypothetical protein Slati_2906000 [Sesamum latifolium]|uniref:Secreted protein n=1 Tax=Sesamum latifolium TaxID=2727402 RepID=A0AAW2VDN7_9LAMI